MEIHESYKEFNEDKFIITESKKVAGQVNLDGHVASQPSFSEFSKIDKSTIYNNEEWALASRVFDPFNKSEEKNYRELQDMLKSYFEGKGANLYTKLKKKSETGRGEMVIPKGIIMNMATMVFEIDPECKWIKDYAYHVGGGSASTGDDYKQFVKDVKEEIKNLKRRLESTVSYENPGFRGITGATVSDRSSHLKTKTAPLLKSVQDSLLGGYMSKPDEVKQALGILQSADMRELYKIMSSIGYHGGYNATSAIIGAAKYFD